MTKRTQGLNDDDAPASAPAQSPAPTSSGPRTKGLNDEPATAPTLPKTTTPASQNSFWYDFIHPQAADLSRPQTTRDWFTKTYDPSAKQIGAAALDDASFGAADWFQSKYSGENIADIRARTAEAQTALGPGAPIINAATYAIPGTGVAKGLKAAGAAGKVSGALGRYGAAGLEGGTAGGLSSVGHQLGDDIDPYKVAKDTALGGVAGVGGQAVGDVTAPAVRYVMDSVTGKPGRGGTLPPEIWRAQHSAGQDIFPTVTQARQRFPLNGPEDQALANVQRSLMMPTEPGPMAGAVKAGTALGAGAVGWHGGGPIGGLFGLGSVGGINRAMVDPVARGINKIDRSINVNQSLDDLYPAFKDPRVTTNVAPWVDAIRQLSIGAYR